MTRMWKLIWICAAAAVPGFAIVPFETFAAPEPAPGLALSQKYCAECHVIAPSASKGWTNAPTFEAIANRPGTTVANLTATLEKPHMKMLNTERPPNEARAIATYIMTLRSHP
jgi:mono/diheme cytochrome c family protein